MAEAALHDTVFHITGEEAPVSNALAELLKGLGADVRIQGRLEEVNLRADCENVLLAHFSGTPGLASRLPAMKNEDPALRVVLMHEITERGHVQSELLSVTDHLLEKPFTRQTLDKALTQLRFHPLAGKSVYVLENAAEPLAANVLKSLGATLITEAGTIDPKAPPELAVMSPDAIDDSFRLALAVFRQFCPDVPVFMLYNPQAPGILDSELLKEIAYLVQQPVTRQVFRQKMLTYFDQPQKERRKSPRKQGISQMWISAFNLELGAPELFESPFLIDISQTGLSFQTYIRYPEGQLMAIWIVAEEYPDKIIDLRGHIRWQKQDAESAGMYKYGVEFTRQDSEAYRTFARMIAMH